MDLLVKLLLWEIQIATVRPSQLFSVSAEDLGPPLLLSQSRIFFVMWPHFDSGAHHCQHKTYPTWCLTLWHWGYGQPEKYSKCAQTANVNKGNIADTHKHCYIAIQSLHKYRCRCASRSQTWGCCTVSVMDSWTHSYVDTFEQKLFS